MNECELLTPNESGEYWTGKFMGHPMRMWSGVVAILYRLGSAAEGVMFTFSLESDQIWMWSESTTSAQATLVLSELDYEIYSMSEIGKFVGRSCHALGLDWQSVPQLDAHGMNSEPQLMLQLVTKLDDRSRRITTMGNDDG